MPIVCSVKRKKNEMKLALTPRVFLSPSLCHSALILCPLRSLKFSPTWFICLFSLSPHLKISIYFSVLCLSLYLLLSLLFSLFKTSISVRKYKIDTLPTRLSQLTIFISVIYVFNIFKRNIFFQLRGGDA